VLCDADDSCVVVRGGAARPVLQPHLSQALLPRHPSLHKVVNVPVINYVHSFKAWKRAYLKNLIILRLIHVQSTVNIP
jgi:hypothetical protein